MVKQVYEHCSQPWGRFEYDLAEAVGDPGTDGQRASGVKDDCGWRARDQTAAKRCAGVFQTNDVSGGQ